jgi:adenylate cyclase
MTPDLEPDLKLEIAHVLTIDVVAYSTLLIDEQSRLIAELVRTVKATPRFRQAAAEDKLIKLPTGDGMALVFLSDAEAPIECAMQLTTSLKEHPEIRLRMGIHSGPINTIRDVNDRTNLAGAGIDMAHRVMDCGDAGHILVSKRVADDLAPYPRWHPYLHDLGECEVKHGRKVSLFNFYSESFGNAAIPQKVKCISKSTKTPRLVFGGKAIFFGALGLAGCLAVGYYVFDREIAPKRSIAVLPFVDLSPAKDQEYFSDGITEQITNSLGKVSGLFVVGRTSAFVLKNRELREVGRRLRVSNVIEGSVSGGPNEHRIDVRLVNVNNGYQVWSDAYNSSEKDFLKLQSEVAQKVAVALQVELGVVETERLAKPPTDDPEAYDLYLRGRYLLNKRTAEAIEKAGQLFTEAVKKDPRFALGHAAIADSYILLGEYGQLSVSDAASRAWPELSAALEINEQLAEGYLARAILLGDFQWKWDAAEKDYRQAIRLNPNNATAHHWFALQLAQQGRTEEALKEIAIAQKHDPLSPIIRAAKAKIFLMGRRFADAIAQCRKALELEPNFAPAYSVLAQAFAFQKQFSEAIEAAKRYADLSGGGDQERLELAYVEALAGKKTEAQQVMIEVQRRGKNFSPYDMGAICVALENQDVALEWIEKAITQHAIDVEWIGVDPRMDSIRKDPRFGRLLALVCPQPESS